jgi:hypothetical protein
MKICVGSLCRQRVVLRRWNKIDEVVFLYSSRCVARCGGPYTIPRAAGGSRASVRPVLNLRWPCASQPEQFGDQPMFVETGRRANTPRICSPAGASVPPTLVVYSGMSPRHRPSHGFRPVAYFQVSGNPGVRKSRIAKSDCIIPLGPRSGRAHCRRYRYLPPQLPERAVQAATSRVAGLPAACQLTCPKRQDAQRTLPREASSLGRTNACHRAHAIPHSTTNRSPGTICQ